MKNGIGFKYRGVYGYIYVYICVYMRSRARAAPVYLPIKKNDDCHGARPRRV